jgi:hypothetical protein
VLDRHMVAVPGSPERAKAQQLGQGVPRFVAKWLHLPASATHVLTHWSARLGPEVMGQPLLGQQRGTAW